MSNSNLFNLYSNVIRHDLTLDEINNLNLNPLNNETLKKIRSIYLNCQVVFSDDLQRSSGMSWAGRQIFSLSRRVYALFCEKTVIEMTLTLLKRVQVDTFNQENKIKSALLAKLKIEAPDPWMSEDEITQKIDEVQASIRKKGEDIDESLVEDDLYSRIKEVIIQKLAQAHLPQQLFHQVWRQSDQTEIGKIDPLVWTRFNAIVSYLIEARKNLIEKHLAQDGSNSSEKAMCYAEKIIEFVVSNIKPNETLESIQKDLNQHVEKITDEAFKVLNGKIALSSDGFFDQEANTEIIDRSEKIKRSLFAESRICDPLNGEGIEKTVKRINQELTIVIIEAKRHAHLRFSAKVCKSIKESQKPFLDEFRSKGLLLLNYETDFNNLMAKLEALSLESVKEIIDTLETLYKLLSVQVKTALGEEEENNNKIYQKSLSILASLITKIVEDGTVNEGELNKIINAGEITDFSDRFFEELKLYVFEILNAHPREIESLKPLLVNKLSLLSIKFNNLKSPDINSKKTASIDEVLKIAFDIGDILLELQNRKSQASDTTLSKIKEKLLSLEGILLNNQMRQLRLKSLYELNLKLERLPIPEWTHQTGSSFKMASSEYVPTTLVAPNETAIKLATWADLKFSQTAPIYLFNLDFLEESEIPEFAERMSDFHHDKELAKKEYIGLLTEICKKSVYPRPVFVEEFWSYVLPKLPEFIKVLQQPQVPNLLHLYTIMDPDFALMAYFGWLLAHQDKISGLDLNSPMQITHSLNKLSRNQETLKNLKEFHAGMYEFLSSTTFSQFRSVLEGGLTGKVAFTAFEVYFGIKLVGTQEDKFLQLGKAAIDKFISEPIVKSILTYFICLGRAATERHKIEDVLSFLKPLENYSKAMMSAISEKNGVYSLKSKEEIVKTLPILLKSIADILSKILADGSSNMREKKLFRAIQNSVLTFKQHPRSNDYFAQGIHQFITSVIDETLDYKGHFKNKQFVMMTVRFEPMEQLK